MTPQLHKWWMNGGGFSRSGPSVDGQVRRGMAGYCTGYRDAGVYRGATGPVYKGEPEPSPLGWNA